MRWLWILFLVACQPQAPLIISARPVAKKSFDASAQRIKADIELLASPDLGGRGPGAEGLELAADYLSQEMKRAGLLGIGAEGFSWFFEVPAPEPEPSILGADRLLPSVVLQSPKLIVSYGGTPAAKIEAGLVFGLFDEPSPSPNQTVLGKIALIPETQNGQLDVAALRHRIQVALREGAAAVLTVPHEFYPPPLDPPSLGALPILVARVHPKLAQYWLRAMPGWRTLSPQERLPLHAELSLESKGRGLLQARNLIGAIPGTESKKPALVVSAHYDHIGMGRPGWDQELNTLHPGADDNASGTAALLEIARLLAPLPSCQRPIFFIAYAYEEEGLLGSDAIAESLQDRIGAVINLDMVGRFRRWPIEINGEPRELRPFLNEVFPELWSLGEPPSAEGGPQSDHSSFLFRGITAITFTSGLHEDHHRPSDTPDKIAYQKEASLVGSIAKLVREVACHGE